MICRAPGIELNDKLCILMKSIIMNKLSLFLFFSIFLFACNDTDPCDDNCGANGTCDELTETCICDIWYEGESCDIENRAKFIGTWTTLTSDCTNQNGEDLLPVWTIESLDNVDGIRIRSEDIFSNTWLEAGLSADNMIELLAVDAILGNITFIDESNLTFSLSDDETCNFELVR